MPNLKEIHDFNLTNPPTEQELEKKKAELQDLNKNTYDRLTQEEIIQEAQAELEALSLDGEDETNEEGFIRETGN